MKQQRFLLLILITALLLVSAASALAYPANGYEISWWTVDGGGGSGSAGSYALQGTIAQPDAAELSQGNYYLTGGYWGGPRLYTIAIPLVLQ